MANEQNLIPSNRRSKSEVRENGKKGGKKSGESRREKKALREALQELLMLDYDVEGQILGGVEATGVALIKQAIGGNVRAYEVIRDTIGEKPADKVQVETTDIVRSAYERAATAIKGIDK